MSKRRPGGQKQFEDKELQDLLDRIPVQTIKNVSDTLAVDELTF